VGAEDALIID